MLTASGCSSSGVGQGSVVALCKRSFAQQLNAPLDNVNMQNMDLSTSEDNKNKQIAKGGVEVQGKQYAYVCTVEGESDATATASSVLIPR